MRRIGIFLLPLMFLSFRMNSNYIQTISLRILAVAVCICILSCTDRDFDNTLTVAEERVDQTDSIKKAGLLIEDGNLDEAFDLMSNVLSEEPSNVDANIALAGIYLARDQFTKALDVANRAFVNASQDYVSSFNPHVNKKTIHLILSQTYYYIGDFNRSNDQVRQIINKNVNLTPEALGLEIERLARKDL